jgi:hypothetical protein
MGDYSTQEAIIKGKIKIKMTMGVKHDLNHINDVIYVLCLTNNFFFVSKLTSQWYSVKFGDDMCQIKNNKKRVVVHKILIKESVL